MTDRELKSGGVIPSRNDLYGLSQYNDKSVKHFSRAAGLLDSQSVKSLSTPTQTFSQYKFCYHNSTRSPPHDLVIATIVGIAFTMEDAFVKTIEFLLCASALVEYQCSAPFHNTPNSTIHHSFAFMARRHLDQKTLDNPLDLLN